MFKCEVCNRGFNNDERTLTVVCVSCAGELKALRDELKKLKYKSKVNAHLSKLELIEQKLEADAKVAALKTRAEVAEAELAAYKLATNETIDGYRYIIDKVFSVFTGIDRQKIK